eukprot:bmy_07961T0
MQSILNPRPALRHEHMVPLEDQGENQDKMTGRWAGEEALWAVTMEEERRLRVNEMGQQTEGVREGREATEGGLACRLVGPTGSEGPLEGPGPSGNSLVWSKISRCVQQSSPTLGDSVPEPRSVEHRLAVQINLKNLLKTVAQRLRMVRTTSSQMGGHRLVQRGPEMTGVWVAVVKGTVGMCRVAHIRRALRQVCRQHPRSSCRVEESSWRPPGGRCQSRAARTWGNTQSPKEKKQVPDVREGGGSHSPVTCGGEQESDAE